MVKKEEKEKEKNEEGGGNVGSRIRQRLWRIKRNAYTTYVLKYRFFLGVANINQTSRRRHSSTTRNTSSHSSDPEISEPPVLRISVPFRNNPILKKNSKNMI